MSYGGWQTAWELSLPAADVDWLKHDVVRGLFRDVEQGKRRVLKDDCMWFRPPERPGVISNTVPSADAFFHSRLFFWRPVAVWDYSLRCPRRTCPSHDQAESYLSHCGYSHTVRYICDVSDWYIMLTEVLACPACSKDQHIGRFTAWDSGILSQLTPAHQALFPAVLTPNRGVDKKVINMLKNRIEEDTMVKTLRQIQEKHCQEYLQRMDMYTTLLYSLISREGGMHGQKFQHPPPRRELPSAKLIKKAFLMSEAEHIEDYRTQIMSTFGRVLKMTSTKKVCKKFSGSAEWCTTVANEHGQVLTSVLTCDQSLEMLLPMAAGLMTRYKAAGEAPPVLMYVDRGCCRLHDGMPGVSALFDQWVEQAGMIVRLDVCHWMEGFDEAVSTDRHTRYSAFKSALWAAVFACNQDDVALLARAVRAGTLTGLRHLSDAEVIHQCANTDDLQHSVRRQTLGAQETRTRVEQVINALKGHAGLDENGVHLFRDDAAIDEVWASQQKHLPCIQDPAGVTMYTVLRRVTRNGVSLPCYESARGTNSLEGFHKYLWRTIPGPRCPNVPLQVYLLSGIARWNADLTPASSGGQKVRASPLIARLNDRCRQLFGHAVDANVRAPVVAGDEPLGLELLLSQSEEDFDISEYYADTRAALRERHDDETVESMEPFADLHDADPHGADPWAYDRDSSTSDSAFSAVATEFKRQLEALVSKKLFTPVATAVQPPVTPTVTPMVTTAVTPSVTLLLPQPITLASPLPPSSQNTAVIAPQPLNSQQTAIIPPSTQHSDIPTYKVDIGKSTYYKRKRMYQQGIFPKRSFISVKCKLCGEKTIGHSRYKKKVFCNKTKMSSSKNLTCRLFQNLDDFKNAVDTSLQL